MDSRWPVPGQLRVSLTIGEVEIRYYRINDAGREVEYFRTELEGVKVVSISPIVNDTRNSQLFLGFAL
jgi:type VI secretion system Hcp family effector